MRFVEYVVLVLLIVLEKVSVIHDQFVYLARSCIEVRSFSLPQRVKISRFCRVGPVVGFVLS